jgi:hypothetical protein
MSALLLLLTIEKECFVRVSSLTSSAFIHLVIVDMYVLFNQNIERNILLICVVLSMDFPLILIIFPPCQSRHKYDY